MNKSVRIVFITVLFFLLILVRAFAPKMFYDPFIAYFQNDYLTSQFPQFDYTKLFASLFFRFTINSVISLIIIYLFFQKRALILFATKFYIVTFIVLAISYFLLLKTAFSSGYLLAFYIRRMLIHPIFLLLLLPAFYYQKRILKN